MKRLIFIITCNTFIFNLLAQDYFPLKVGNTWILEEFNTNGISVGTDTATIKDNYVVDKLNIFLWVEKIGTDLLNSELFTDSINNNDIFIKIGDANQKLFQHNYTDGDKWAFYDDTIHVKYIGDVDVPMGNFHDCFYVMRDSTSGWVFAPNIGIVKTIENNKTRYVLTKYNVSTTNISAIANELCDNIKIFPNPSSDFISVSNVNNPIGLDIFDMTGKLFYSAKQFYNNAKTIDISNLPKGIYTVRILKDNNIYSSSKFIKK